MRKNVQSSNNVPDMRKVGGIHRNPKLSINLDKSPSVVGGGHEQFGDKLDMITYWEDMEEGEEGRKHEVQPEEGGGRRRSKRVSEICERFEEGEEGRSS